MKGILREDVAESLSTLFFWVLALGGTWFVLVGAGVVLRLMWRAFKLGWGVA